MLRPITLVLPYYLNGSMLDAHQRAWEAYPAELKARLHVIVVDDGSPRDPASDHIQPSSLASFQMFRVLVDVRWNWLFCRNLGVAKAPTDWVLLTDIDHVLPESTLRTLTEGDLSEKDVHRLSRVDAPNLTPYKPHPNTWFLTRTMFDRIGGYDERFSGFYGTDAEFRERVARHARSIVMLPDPMIRYPREVIADASTTTYGRKEPQDHVNVQRIKEERDRLTDWRPLRLTFPYEAVITEGQPV